MRQGITPVRASVFVVLLAGMLAGCENQQDWDWFGMKKKPAQPKSKSVAAEDKQAAEARPVAADTKKKAAKPDDPQAREVDEKVDRYVQNMNENAKYDSSYTGNDFNRKMQRQSDPERSTRIRQTAARSNPDYESPEINGAEDAPAADRNPPRKATNSQIPPTAKSKAPVESTDETPANSPDVSEDSLQPEPKPVIEDERAEPEAKKPVTKSPPVKQAPPARPEPAEAEEPEAEEPKPEPEENSPSPEDDASEEKPAAVSKSNDTPAKPPVLDKVEVVARPDKSPEEKAKVRPAANKPPAASSESPKVADISERITAQESRIAKDPNNLEEQFRLRLMYLIDGQDEKALAPSDGVNAEVLEIMQGQLRALMAARSTADRDPAVWANRQLEAVEKLRNLVRSRADLQVPKVELCTAIEGYGRFEPISPAEFKAGAKANKVLLYIEVDNFTTEKTASGLYRTLLSVRQSLLNKAGEELWSTRDENIEDLARQKRRDFYLTVGPLSIPKSLGPGQYVLKVEVEDVLAGKINSNVAKFKMVP